MGGKLFFPCSLHKSVILNHDTFNFLEGQSIVCPPQSQTLGGTLSALGVTPGAGFIRLTNRECGKWFDESGPWLVIES